MLFNSLHFLVFLPIVVTLYYLLAQKYRWILIFFASCYFYMAFVPSYILILFLIIFIDFFSARVIERSAGFRRRLFLVLSLLSNILLLAFFKYFTFLNENLQQVMQLFGSNFEPVKLSVILPIGLSFHTFQSMGYTIDVYRGNQKAETHLGHFANYVLFFPQMVAGPIERYNHLGESLKEVHSPSYRNFSDAFRLILFGLFVKMTVADNIAPVVNEIYRDPAAHSATEVWMAVFLFSFQIYADFYGYSTIALGSARMLGIRIMDNFRTPYLSASVTEFWGRWHISLSSWFRDYLYIPLGGNRVSLPRWCFNIMVVFMVSGLWHGASWTFVMWGALHGLLILLEKAAGWGMSYKDKPDGVRKVFGIIRTFILTSLIWVFFRAENFQKARDVFNAMFSNFTTQSSDLSFKTPLFFSLILLITDLFVMRSRIDTELGGITMFRRWAFYSVLIFCLFALSGTQKFAFIYFQF